MRIIIIKILLRLLGAPYYYPLSSEEVNSLLTRLSKDEDYDRLPDFLEQCANQYRNQFLYSKDERFRGTVLAFTSLRELLLEKRKPKKKKLTESEESGIIKTVY